MKKFWMVAATIMLTLPVFLISGCNPEDDPNNNGGNGGGGNNEVTVTLTTTEPSEITATTAFCGAEVSVSEGATIDELGVCWSIRENPTAEDSRLFTTTWSEPFTCTITDLEPNTEYHVRAYALRDTVYYYGEDKNFKTDDGHEFVDLGLPSGTLWATCNVGADTPEGYGYYFAWGETQPKLVYDWLTYQFCKDGSYQCITKYCNDTICGNEGFMDHLTTLLPGDDAAVVNWGGGWRTPTFDDWMELMENTARVMTTQNGVDGMLVTASNGGSIFLPAAGSQQETGPFAVGYQCRYWSSELDEWAHSAYCYQETCDGSLASFQRNWGQSVRPVRSAR